MDTIISRLKNIVFLHKLYCAFNQFWLCRWLRIVYWNEVILRPRLREQLRPGKETLALKNDSMGPRILVPLIETSHYQYYQVLLIAKALHLRGAQVKVLLCGSQLNGCEIKSINHSKIDPCMTCRLNAKKIVPEFGLELCELKDFLDSKLLVKIHKQAESIAADYPSRYDYHGVDIIPMVNDSVTRFYYGAVPYNDSGKLIAFRKKYLITAMYGIEVSRALSQSWRPERIFNNMNVYADWAPYYQYFKKQNIPTYTISLSRFNFHAVILNLSEIFVSKNRYARWQASRESKELKKEEKIALQEFVESRFSGLAKIFKQLNFFDNDNLVNRIIKIDRKKRNIFLFSNVFWDVGLSECGGLYDDVISWVLHTINILKDHEECHLYIKTHPGEKYNDGSTSLKGIVDFIFEKYTELPANVTIIYPELKIKTYDLFPYIDIGVVFNGTIGLEMLMAGIPVIACANAPYSRIDLVSEPESEVEYLNMLLHGTELKRPAMDKVELFAYFYFMKLTIPWQLTEMAYGDNFKEFNIQSLDTLLPGNNKYLDHICDCILDSEKTIIEGW